jgi:hypothetical protein
VQIPLDTMGHMFSDTDIAQLRGFKGPVQDGVTKGLLNATGYVPFEDVPIATRFEIA